MFRIVDLRKLRQRIWSLRHVNFSKVDKNLDVINKIILDKHDSSQSPTGVKYDGNIIAGVDDSREKVNVAGLFT